MAVQGDSADVSARLEALEEKLDEGLVPSILFSDETIFELEKRYIFERTWIFLAHESEIPERGDYVVRRIVDNSFIVVRSDDGQIRVFRNRCPLTRAQITHDDRGNADHFRTPGGAVFANTGELADAEANAGVDGDLALEPASKYDVHTGMIYANMDPGAESLEEFFGDWTFYQDFLTGRTPEGMEFRGPQRRIVEMNWKGGVVNNIGDFYHVGVNHLSSLEVGILAGSTDDVLGDGEGADGSESAEQTDRDEDESGEGVLLPQHSDPEKGNPVHVGPGGGNTRPFEYTFAWFPEDLQELHRETLSEEQIELVDTYGPMMNASIFPNQTWLNAYGRIGEQDNREDIPVFSNFRVINPLGPTKSEVLIWHGIDKEADEEYKERSYLGKVFQYGGSGLITQDDTHAWTMLSHASKGREGATNPDLSYRIGLTDHEKIEEAPGPGDTYPYGVSEVNQRHYWRLYVDTLVEGAGTE